MQKNAKSCLQLPVEAIIFFLKMGERHKKKGETLSAPCPLLSALTSSIYCTARLHPNKAAASFRQSHSLPVRQAPSVRAW